MTELRFAYSGSPFADPDAVVDLAVRAEAAGFDAFLLADLPGALSPLIALAAVAQATSTIGVGTFVLNTGLWNPATIARELATLDRVSGGRLEIGLGGGIPLPALDGIVPPTREARLEWLEATVGTLGEAIEQRGIDPGFAGRPRVLIAASGNRTLRLAAARADGVLIAAVPPVPKVTLPPGELVLPASDAVERYLERLRGYAETRADELEIGTSAAVVLTDDAAAHAAELAKMHTYLTADELRSSPKILIGTRTEIAAQIRERARTLGITYHVLRGATPEELSSVLAEARGT